MCAIEVAIVILAALMLMEAEANVALTSTIFRRVGTFLTAATLCMEPIISIDQAVASDVMQSEGTTKRRESVNPQTAVVPKGFGARARTRSNYRPRVYSVESSSPPSLQPRTFKGESDLLKRLGRADILLVGMDPGDSADYSFVNNLLQKLRQNSAREVIIGLDGIVTAGRALDAEEAAEGARTAMSSSTSINEKEAKLTDSFLKLAKEEKCRVLPCGVDLGTIQKTITSGFESLSNEERERYVSDTNGFVSSVTSKGFKRYADTVIADNFARKGTRETQLTAEKFFAVQILQNEGTATALSRYANEHSKESLVVLVTDNARIRFGFGLQDRTKALLMTGEEAFVEGGSEGVLSILINPSAQETLSQSSQLRLSLAYGKFLPDQHMLADFVWFSDEPPLKLLTRPKNPISREGDKPPGESSVIGAFNARN